MSNQIIFIKSYAVERFSCDGLTFKYYVGMDFREKEENKSRELPLGMRNMVKFSKGSFMMGEVGKEKRIEIDHNFEMMPNLVTQAEWVEVMGENPSHFKDGRESIEIAVGDKKIKMLPRHPVEYISWWSSIIFANRMSERAGLEPVFDVSGVKFEGRAEDGTLEAISGELKISSSDGKITSAEGFRLSEEAEYEYMLKDSGRDNGEFIEGKSNNTISDVAWNVSNSNGKTQPVEIKTVIRNGQDMSDLVGNVWQWQFDKESVRGGSWFSSGSDCRSADRSGFRPANRSSFIGLRLLRTIYP